jgi:hypothetical protein
VAVLILVYDSYASSGAEVERAYGVLEVYGERVVRSGVCVCISALSL